jgi:8-oxo-dGTP diphosphatase
MESAPRPKLATCVLVFKDGKVLLNKRKGDGRTDGMYGTPGGHVENLETFVACVTREIAEEAGVEVENIVPIAVSNVRDFPPAHYVVISLRADWKSGEPQNLEPEASDGWGWFALDALPSPLTPATEDAIEASKSGKVFFDE